MKKILFIFLILPSVLIAQNTADPEPILTQHSSSSDFILFQDQQAAAILVDPNDQNTVLLATQLFADDVERVTGVRPAVLSHPPSEGGEPLNLIIMGCMETSQVIKGLIKRDVIDISDVRGKWEACITEVVDHPFPGVVLDKIILDTGGVEESYLGPPETRYY